MSRSLLSLSLGLLVLAAVAAAHGGHHADDDDDVDVDAPSSEGVDLRAKPLILVKIYCLILEFVGTFIAGVSPYFLKMNETFLVLGTQFAGGVFLGTAMMHFLSDSNETFGDLTSVEYPFAFMLACAGYLMTMFSDGFDFLSNMQGKSSSNGGNSVSLGQVQNRTEVPFANAPLKTATSLGDSILLIFALCFHSVFEGIAVGVAETKADAWRALWTICLHKIFAAIAMGIALLRMIPDRPLLSCVAYAFAFAISSPVGVAIGIVIDATTQGAVADWIFAISMGLACGIFIYVSINHLLSKGYTSQNTVPFDTPTTNS
ncbi:hypothetical protein AAG906_010216 [Vitis piasezkii]